MSLYANRYERIDFLGRGVTGEVIHAVDQKTGQKCALKFLRTARKMPGQQGSSLRDFQNEFEVLKKLNHPNIAKVYDAGFDDQSERYYMATELVEGKDLFNATEEADISIIEDLFVQALRALNYIHKQNILHFDIKPQNFLITKDGNGKNVLKLIDFGFANFYERKNQKAGDEDGDWTIIGTAAYTAPEIILGESYTGAADLYSLGCTFYKIFTRELPFRASNPEDIHIKHLEENPTPPSKTNGKVPEYLDAILIKLLAKQPENRYQTGAEVIEDINLVSDTSYKIETSETIMSYVLEQGVLVGRDEEFNLFKEYYEDRIKFEFLTKKSMLFVVGESGLGKTRFLEECKNLARKNFVNIMSWEEYWNIEPDKVKKPLFVYGDNLKIDKEEAGYFNIFTEKEAVLAVLTTDHYEQSDDKDNIIELKKFTKAQTLEYLFKATGLKEIPQNIIDIIQEQTSGIPLYLTEYVRTLFEKGFFKDEHGDWSPEILDDLGDEIEKLSPDDFIKSRLAERLDTIELDEFLEELLYTMALTGSPTLEDLNEITNASVIVEQLKIFIDKGILRQDHDGRYVFSNPNYRKIILERIPAATKSEYCDKIADYLEHRGQDKERVLYYRGRGSRSTAAISLFELTKEQRQQFKYKEARDNLLELSKRQDLDASIVIDVYLELANLNADMASYDLSNEVLLQLQEQNITEEVQAICLEKMGANYIMLRMYDKAKTVLLEANNLIADKDNLRWLKVKVDSRLSFCELVEGNIDNAEKIALDAWHVWKNDLTDEERSRSAASNLDTIYIHKGEHKKAIECTEAKLEALKDMQHDEGYSRALAKLGIAYLALGEKEKGKNYLIQSIEVSKERKMPNWLYSTYNELGVLEKENKNYEKALFYYKHAMDLARKTSVGIHFYVICLNMVVIYQKLEDYDAMIKYSEFVLKNIFDEKYKKEIFHFNYCLFTANICLGIAHSNKGEKEKADKYFNECYAIISSHVELNKYYREYWAARGNHYIFNKEKSNTEKVIKEFRKIAEESLANKEHFMAWLTENKTGLENMGITIDEHKQINF